MEPKEAKCLSYEEAKKGARSSRVGMIGIDGRARNGRQKSHGNPWKIINYKIRIVKRRLDNTVPGTYFVYMLITHFVLFTQAIYLAKHLFHQYCICNLPKLPLIFGVRRTRRASSRCSKNLFLAIVAADHGRSL